MSKRLFRSKDDRVIAGVCGGIAQYLDIDPTIIRIIFVLIFLTEGFGLMLYLILWVVVPEEDSVAKDSGEVMKENAQDIKENVRKATRDIKTEVKSDTKKEENK